MQELVSVSIPDDHTLAGVGSLTEALAHLEANKVDLILTDLSLPDAKGMETLHKLSPKAPGVPIIVLSGYDDEKTSLDALRAGAQDYLVKGEVSSHLLRHAIRYAIERKRLDAALSIERDLVDNLLENIPDRIYFKDLSSHYLRINKAMASLFGVDESYEAIGMSDQDFFSSDHANSTRAAEKRVIETRRPLIGHIEKERLNNGSDCWVMTTKMPLVTASNEVVGTFGISRDITQLKQAEEQLEGAIARNRQLAESLKQLAALTANEVAEAATEIGQTEGGERLQLAAERLRKIARLDQETELRAAVPLKELFTDSMTKLGESGGGIPLEFRPANFPTLVGNAELLEQLAIELLRAITEAATPDAIVLTAHETKQHWEITIAGPRTADAEPLAFAAVNSAREFPANILALSLCQRIAEGHDGKLMIGLDPAGVPAFRLTLGQ